jgi:hypothetical protein
MNRTPPDDIPQSRNDGLRYYMALIALVITGPIVTAFELDDLACFGALWTAPSSSYQEREVA